MSFDKKSNKFDLDKLNLKDRLNASLENEGISVSDDLINRTLDAIKNQKVDDLDYLKDNDKNFKPAFILRKTRILVSAAAAVIILLVGMSAINLLSSDKKQSDEYAKYNYSGSSEKADLAPQITMESDVSESILADDEMKIASDEYDLKGNNAENGEDLSKQKGVGEDNINLTSALTVNEIGFAEIASIEAGDAKSVSITSVISGKTVMFSDKDRINQFYAKMASHSFIRETDGKAEGQYIVEITGQDKVSKIVIGKDIIEADLTDNEIASHSIYSAVDYNRLAEELDYLLQQ